MYMIGIAFCDLKPSNIMRRSVDASWKLIDFEASRTIGEECVGVITPRYCPPEVARATTYGLEGANGVVATPSVDLWALGCVIYELETKHALFAGNIKDETILHFISHPSPSTPILNNGLRWNEHKELYIPNLERKIPDTRTRQLIKMLLSREPSKRGSASTLLVSSSTCYTCDICITSFSSLIGSSIFPRTLISHLVSLSIIHFAIKESLFYTPLLSSH